MAKKPAKSVGWFFEQEQKKLLQVFLATI